MKKFVRKNKKGFTLTEMIVVIAIIGILAAVMIPSVVIYVNKARESAAQQEAAAVVDIYEVYLTEQAAGLLPSAEEDADLDDDAVYDFEDYYFEITGKKLDAVAKEGSENVLVFTASNGKTVEIDLSQYQANAGN